MAIWGSQGSFPTHDSHGPRYHFHLRKHVHGGVFRHRKVTAIEILLSLFVAQGATLVTFSLRLGFARNQIRALCRRWISRRRLMGLRKWGAWFWRRRMMIDDYDYRGATTKGTTSLEDYFFILFVSYLIIIATATVLLNGYFLTWMVKSKWSYLPQSYWILMGWVYNWFGC